MHSAPNPPHETTSPPNRYRWATSTPLPPPPTPQYLNAPGDVYVTAEGPSVLRYPLVYTPRSTTQINFARLPAQDALRDMDLAYREQLMTDAEIQQRMRRDSGLLIFGGLVGSYLLIAVGAHVTLDAALQLAAAVSVLLIYDALRHRKHYPEVFQAVVKPLGIALNLFWIAKVLSIRALATGLLGVVTFVIFYRWGDRPLYFYQGWLLTHPRLRPETRARVQLQQVSPDYVLLGTFIALAILLPQAPTTLTLVTVLALALLRTRPRGLGHVLGTVLGPFLSYGERSSYAPGIWRASDSIWQRRGIITALALSLYLLLMEGLCFFFPADLIGLLGGYHSSLAYEPWTWAEFYRPMMDQYPATALFIPASLAYAFIVPNLVLLAIYAKALRQLDELRRTIEGETDSAGTVHGGLDDDGRPEWQWYVDRLRTSPHRAQDPLNPLGSPVREADHLFLGVEPNIKFPVLLDRAILAEHCYIVGETGSGKTSLGIMPLVLQLLRGPRPRDVEQSPTRPAIVVLDLKGDPALFHTLREECDREAIPFRFFTPEPGRASHYFNAFSDLKSESRSLIQLAQLILDSLALSHGEGYGRSYYSRQSRHALLTVLKKRTDLNSFTELFAALETLKRDKKDAFELVSTIHALTFYPQLVTSPSASVPLEHIIHMPRVLEEQQVVYFWLPAALESASVREIGKLALFALLTAAIDRQRAGGEFRQAYVVIDEFQRLAGENFKIILEQARSFGLSAILANQTQHDLVTPDADLRATVRTNTRTKLFFTVTDPAEVRTLVESSGEELALMRGFGSTAANKGWIGSQTWTEALKPRLTPNDVIAASDHPLHCIAHVSRGSGYTQFGGFPLAVRSTWPLSRDTYAARSRAPWPSFEAGLATGATPISEIERQRSEEAAAAELAQKAALEELVARKAPKT